MPPWIRRSLIGLAAVLLVLVAGALLLVATFDANRYKGVAIDWMKANRNRTLAIDGPLELSVFPRLALRASRVSLSEAGRSERFASVEQAALSVALLPLLQGRLQVDRVEASGVQVVLRRDAQGRRNTDDLAGGAPAGPAPAAPPASAAARAPLAFDISGVVLKDVRATVQDVPAKLDGTLQLVELSTGRLTPGLDTPVTLDARLDFRQPALKGTLVGRLRVAPQAGGALRLADIDLAWRGDLPGLAAAELTLAMSRFSVEPARQALSVDRLKLGLKARRAAGPLALTLDWAALDIEGQRLKGSPLQGTLSLGGATSVELAFKTGAPAGSFDSVTLPNLDARVSGSGAGRKIDGQVRGRVTAGPKAASWALNGQVNGNAFTLDGNAKLDGAVPFVKAQAKFDALDLNTLLPEGASAGTTGEHPGPAPDDTPVDLSGLKALNAQLALRAGTLVLRQYHVANARVEANLDNGLLRVPVLQGQAWDGTLDASAQADAKGNRVAVKALASGVNINALLKDVAGKDLLEGQGRVTLDVASAGATVGQLRSRLGGSAALQLRDGAVKGINLAKTLRQAKAALGMADRSQKSSRDEKTDFSELSASFRIADGVARSDDLDLKSPYLRVGGDGLVDIGRGLIDYTARVSVTDTSAGQGGAELAALKGVTVPVRLTGPFEAIDWNIRWSAVAAGAVRNKLEDKLKERLGVQPAAPGASAPKTRDALKNKLLKGILK